MLTNRGHTIRTMTRQEAGTATDEATAREVESPMMKVEAIRKVEVKDEAGKEEEVQDTPTTTTTTESITSRHY